MDHGERCRQLAGEVEAALAANNGTAEYSTALRQVLTARGGILSESPRARWGGFVLMTCESASSGPWAQALPAGAAMEVLAAALELLDDLEDGDSRRLRTRRQRALAINAACGLIMVSQLCILRLYNHRQVAGKVPRISELFLSAAVRIGGGQHLDLTCEGRGGVSQDECLAIASLKSAELVRCACEIGATLGADDERLIDLYARFGWHLGMYAQIVNDIEGIRSGGNAKSDLSRLKATLPIAFWLNGQGSSHQDRQSGPLPKTDEDRIRQEIARSGALHYAWVVADTHRQQAEDILLELDRFRPASSILGSLVEPVGLDIVNPS